MRRCLLIIFWIPFLCSAQKQEGNLQQQKFYNMVDRLLDHTVEEVSVDAEIPANTVILDARSTEEFGVSHLETARFVGYDDFEISRVADIEKDTEILVYCSVGYRSEKVAEKLKKAGYLNVRNLYGGLFDWANHGMEMVDSLGKPTNQVHGFNKNWGKWLDGPEVIY